MRTLSAILLVGLAAAWSASPAMAQSATKSWGVTAGFGIGYGTITEDSSREMEPTFNAGVFAELPLSERWSFRPELKYDRRTITIGNISTEASFISVPVLLTNKVWGIYFVQGVSLNFLTSAEIFDVDFTDAHASPDVALIVGAGKRFGRLSVEGRWETGFRTFQKDVPVGGTRLRTLTGVVSFHF